MEAIRYKPGEAIRWLQTGAENIRKGAKAKGRSLVKPEDYGGSQSFGANVKTAAGAIFDVGKSTWADLLHNQASASEYVLQDEHFDIVSGGSIRSVEYSRVKRAEQKGDKVTFWLDRGSISIKPYAYIVAGRIKVPVGWTRNGMEVPYELLIEELTARCRVNLQHL